MTLLARRAVGDHAHGIDRLGSRSRRHQHALTGERPGAAQDRLGRGGDFERLGHAADAGFAALGHFAGIRTDHTDAVRLQPRKIALRRLGRPHARVHRRRDQDRLVGREQDGGGEIVRPAGRHPGHEIGRRRRHHDQIGVARHANMTDVELGARIEQIGIGAFAAERADGKRCDEMLRGGGENATQRGAAFLQAPNEIERFIGGDASADDEQNARSAQGRGDGRRVGRTFKSGAWRARGRLMNSGSEVVWLAFAGGAAQNGAHFVLHRTAVFGRADAEPLLQALVKLADGEAASSGLFADGFGIILADDCIAINAIT